MMGMFMLGTVIGFTAGNFNGAYVMRKTIEKAKEVDDNYKGVKEAEKTRQELKKMASGLDTKV